MACDEFLDGIVNVYTWVREWNYEARSSNRQQDGAPANFKDLLKGSNFFHLGSDGLDGFLALKESNKRRP